MTKQTITEHYGSRLQTFIAECFGTQQQAADFFGVEQGTVSNWTRKQHFSPAIMSKRLYKIAEKGYNPAWLVDPVATKMLPEQPKGRTIPAGNLDPADLQQLIVISSKLLIQANQ
jgi:transcriptional regulator with XRE-family HTH domain